jgi:RHS repeat-associated protein
MEAPLIKNLTVETPSGLQSTMSQSRVITQVSGLTVTGQIDSVKINGRIYRTIYDGNLKQFTNITPEGRQTVTRIDSKGRVIEETVTGVSPITYAYDPLGRLIETLQGDRKSTFAYDALSRLASATDPLLRTTTFAYDSVGRITQQVLPGAREILYAYDSNGNLTSLTPPGKPAHVFDYTAVDLTQRYAPPPLNGDTAATRYLYNLDRLIRNTIRPDSIVVSVFYDTLGCGTCGTARPKTIIFDRGTLNFAYDSTTGLLSSLSAPGGNALTYNYDGTLPKKVTWSGEVQGSVEVTYDNDFRVTSQKVNGGNSVNFQYDNDGLLKAAGSLTITRDAQNGRISGTTLGNVTASQSYNSFSELSGFQAKFGPTALFETAYAQDSLGRITEIIETIQGETRKFNYVYDAAGRLSEMSRNDTLLAIYEYDANGNRLNHYTPSATTTGTYDSQDRLLTYGNAGYSYTRNGELLTKVVGTDTTRYTYDAFGNLVSVRLPDGTNIEYVIDGQNRRVGKKANGAFVKRWLYQNQLNIVAELDGAGNLVNRFVYGTKPRVPDYMVKGGVTYRIVTDHLGSVRLVVNSSTGAVVQHMDYDEFGNITTDTNPSFQPFGFAGGLYDEHTKLVRFGARDYDASVGRWTSKDPILFAGGDSQLYRYVGNDPVNFVDSFGLYAGIDDITFAVGGALLGVGGQALSDLLSGQISGWEDYVGSALGGAAGGWALLYTGPVGAGAVGGAATNLTKQFLKKLTGENCDFDVLSLLVDTGIGAVTGYIPGMRISGITAGRGSYNAIFNQMTTKLKEGTISTIRLQTAVKMFVGRAVDKALVPGTVAGAIAGFGASKILSGRQ